MDVSRNGTVADCATNCTSDLHCGDGYYCNADGDCFIPGLATGSAGGMTVDLTRAASRLGPNRWPMIYLQAVSRTGFGTRSWF